MGKAPESGPGRSFRREPDRKTPRHAAGTSQGGTG